MGGKRCLGGWRGLAVNAQLNVFYASSSDFDGANESTMQCTVGLLATYTYALSP